MSTNYEYQFITFEAIPSAIIPSNEINSENIFLIGYNGGENPCECRYTIKSALGNHISAIQTTANNAENTANTVRSEFDDLKEAVLSGVSLDVYIPSNVPEKTNKTIGALPAGTNIQGWSIIRVLTSMLYDINPVITYPTCTLNIPSYIGYDTNIDVTNLNISGIYTEGKVNPSYNNRQLEYSNGIENVFIKINDTILSDINISNKTPSANAQSIITPNSTSIQLKLGDNPVTLSITYKTGPTIYNYNNEVYAQASSDTITAIKNSYIHVTCPIRATTNIGEKELPITKYGSDITFTSAPGSSESPVIIKIHKNWFGTGNRNMKIQGFNILSNKYEDIKDLNYTTTSEGDYIVYSITDNVGERQYKLTK